MALNIRKRTYGNYSSDNYGAHCLELQIGGVNLWFSYDTVVGFQTPGHLPVVSENCWGPTTGKHLNWLDGGSKQNRLPREAFEEKLRDAMTAHNIQV